MADVEIMNLYYMFKFVVVFCVDAIDAWPWQERGRYIQSPYYGTI